MSDLSFKPYQDAHDAYVKDIAQLTQIGDRLVASAKGVRDERIKDADKPQKLQTINAQMHNLPQAFKDAENKFNAAIDAADAGAVEKFRALCAYAVGTGQGDVDINYLLEECKAYDRAKGDFKLRRALHAQIVDIAGSVADASEKKKADAPSSEVLNQLNALEGEEQTAYYRKHQDEIWRAHQAFQDKAQP
jgi:hypothetical protein